ncbi:MAG: glycosyltransferase family 4 protein [Anaerolineaceae bacterium]|nr:glycosyltransferase family 4 protein [Anaerolineaceae bacterium]
MKILIATTNFPRWQGDFRVPFIYEAAKAIQAKGNIVRVVTMHNPGSQEHELMEGLEVFRVRYLPESKEKLQQDAAGIPAAWERGLRERLPLVPFFYAYTKAVGRLAEDCDIIHANWSLSGLAALLTRRSHKLPCVVTVQGSDVFKTLTKPVIRQMVGLALRKAGKVIALSQALKAAALEFGLKDEHVVVIPNGINISQFPYAALEEKKTQVLFVGSLIERKGPLYLLQAMRLVHQSLPEANLVLVGEGDERARLEQFIAENAMADYVCLAGTQSQSAVSSLMRESRLFVLPSIEEGQGVVLMEALASGTPCVGSRVGGIPDVVTEDVGRLVEPGDVNGLAEAIRAYLTDTELWQKASAAGRQRVLEYYDWNHLADEITAIYAEVLAERRA